MRWNRAFLHGIFEQTPEGTETVFPFNLLAFFVGASPIADADFVNSEPTFSNFHRDLGLESEALFLDRN